MIGRARPGFVKALDWYTTIGTASLPWCAPRVDDLMLQNNTASYTASYTALLNFSSIPPGDRGGFRGASELPSANCVASSAFRSDHNQIDFDPTLPTPCSSSASSPYRAMGDWETGYSLAPPLPPSLSCTTSCTCGPAGLSMYQVLVYMRHRLPSFVEAPSTHLTLCLPRIDRTAACSSLCSSLSPAYGFRVDIAVWRLNILYISRSRGWLKGGSLKGNYSCRPVQLYNT